MVRKVAFFYNVAFCDLSYNKNTKLWMENFGSAAQLFPASRFSRWMYKTWRPQFLRWSDFSSFSQLLPNFQNFPAYGSAFPAATAATAAAFPAFWRRSSRIATGAAAQVGMALPWDYARLVKFGRTATYWMNCQILVKLENKNLDYVSLKNKKRVNKIHSTSSV